MNHSSSLAEIPERLILGNGELSTMSFPNVKQGQLCQYETFDGWVNAYVSNVFDEGFVIKRKDGKETRFLKDKWNENNEKSLVFLHRKGKPVMHSDTWSVLPILVVAVALVCWMIVYAR